jgi:hypothetical protein
MIRTGGIGAPATLASAALEVQQHVATQRRGMLHRVATNDLATVRRVATLFFPVLFCSTGVSVLRCWRGADILQETTFASGQASV